MAVIATACEPSSSASSKGEIGNVTEPAPGGTTTVDGTVASGPPASRLTVSSCWDGGEMASVAVTGPSPSTADSGAVMASDWSSAVATRMSSNANPSVLIR